MAGSEREAKPGEERTTERRLVSASAVMQAAPEAPRTPDSVNEDFLFHLYRGSELLQDNRVHEAKEELEQALTLQPRDPKSQDLLAVVYFRIGLYPRAIQIFEQLKRDNPREPSIKLNLALSYLKTGQAEAARAELEDVVRLHPSHKRAWGYLGLAYERTGELEKAQNAFERGGHGPMAARIGERLVSRGAAPSSGGAANAEVRGVVATAFEELDAGEITFSLAEPVTGSSSSGTWRAIEPGAVSPPRSSGGGWTVPPSAEAVASVRAEAAATAATPVPAEPGPRDGAPPPLVDLAHARCLAFPERPGVRTHAGGLVLVRVGIGHAVAARLESIRLQTGELSYDVLPRQARGKNTGESFGGLASPLVKLAGSGELALGPRPSHAIVAFTLSDESIVVREEVLLGFEPSAIAYECGRLPLGDGETAHVVELRGSGCILLELLDSLHTVVVATDHPALVRRDALVGWSGAIAPRAVPPADVPSGQRGLLSLTGSGTALLVSS